jgi:alpha-beta hydrolase superfamily lysophospholipase
LSTIRHEEGRAASPDDLALYWQSWRPDAPKAVLLFVHGLAEHSGRYRNPVDYFAPRGYGCYALDYRGHGRSPGARVHVASFDEYVADVRTVQRLAVERCPRLPLFLVGHSQGGLVVLRHALTHPEGVSGIIVDSPVLGVHPSSRPSAALKLLAGVLARVAPRLRLPSGLDATRISRDPAVVRAYLADPLVSRSVSSGWFMAMQETLALVHDAAPRFSVPALVMAAGDDRLVDSEATREWTVRAPRELVTFVLWEGLYHEAFNEPEREQVFRRMETWLDERLRARW